jgi:hypothetical protein
MCKSVGLLGALVLFNIGCILPPVQNIPTMKAWDEKEFTLCCRKGESDPDCTTTDWVYAVQQHCTGSATSKRGFNEEKVVGARMSSASEQDPYNFFAGKSSTDVENKFVTHQCVTYVCNGSVRP